MKVLMINTSPHEMGCTYTAFQEVASQLEGQGIASEILWIGKDAMHGCVACGYCNKEGKCVYSEDKVNEAADKARSADGLIIGAPVHYASAAGIGSAFLDRLFKLISKDMPLKPGASVVSCRRGGASATFDQLNKYLTICQMPVISSTYWNSVHGNTPEEVRQDIEGMQVMRNLGKNMAWMLKTIDAAGIPKPEKEAQIKTNFIR